MDMPMCKTCGERHRMGPCPKFMGKSVDKPRSVSAPVARKPKKGKKR